MGEHICTGFHRLGLCVEPVLQRYLDRLPMRLKVGFETLARSRLDAVRRVIVDGEDALVAEPHR